MNMTNSIKYVRTLLSTNYDLATIEFWAEDVTTAEYVAMLRPKGQVTYRRVRLLVCGRNSVAERQWINHYGISPGGAIARKLDYGLGSWCCVARKGEEKHLSMILVLSTKLQNRELNQGTY